MTDYMKSAYKIQCASNKAPKAGQSVSKPIRKTVPQGTKTYGILTGKCNNLTVVDLDTDKWADFNNHDFIKEFSKDFIKRFNTYTVATPSGGYHLYFQYEATLKNTTNDIQYIDIRNNNGYVCRGMVDYVKGGVHKKGKYTIKNNVSPATMPDDLLEYLYHITGKKSENNERISNTFIYDIPVADCWEIAQKLLEKDPDYFGKSQKWHTFTNFSSHITNDNGKSAWEQFSKLCLQKYDETNNERIYERSKNNPSCALEVILNDADMKERACYYKYKPWDDLDFIRELSKARNTPIDNKLIDAVINRPKLGYDFIDSYGCGFDVLIHSDMGTGKSTSFAHYIADNDLKFISITSRRLLAYSQYDAFNNVIEDVDYQPTLYDSGIKLNTGMSVICQVESLLKLQNFDFSEYVIFIDEVSSLINHIVKSDTLNKNRSLIIELMCRMISQCAQLIGADADVDLACHMLFKSLRPNYRYVVNQYIHNDGVPSFEFESLDQLIDHVATLDKFMIPCDSLKQSTYIHTELQKRGITTKLITSETNNSSVNLDDHDRVIYSPAIIYGLDSVMRRGIYPVYIGHTINPYHFVQQVCRCRSITELGYLFINKYGITVPIDGEWQKIRESIIQTPKYDDIECLYAYCEWVKNFDLITINNYNDVTMSKLYNELFVYYEYRDDALNSNKFKHFLLQINKRGFNNEHRYIKNSYSRIAKQKDIQKFKNSQFTPDELNPYHQRINDILQVPLDKLPQFNEYFTDSIKLRGHFNYCRWRHGDYAVNKTIVADTPDFKQQILKSDKAKVVFIHKFMKTYNITISEDTGKGTGNDMLISATVPDNENKNKKFTMASKVLFGIKSNKSQLVREGDIYVHFGKILGLLMCNADIVVDKRVSVKKDGVRTQIRKYYLNADYTACNDKLYNWRCVPDNLTCDYDDEL